MIESLIAIENDRKPKILVLGAHSDDIEIGCGATLQVLAQAFPAMVVRWVVFSAKEERKLETISASKMLFPQSVELQHDVQFFRDGFFPYIGAAIKEHFEQLKREFDPDLIFTHYNQDKHQDHRLIAELTKNTFRDHLILEYEVAKYDGDLASPEIFVPLSSEVAEKKIEVLMSSFPSQRKKRWFSAENFYALMRLRGVESNAPHGFAEAFHCKKMRIRFR